MTTHTQTRNTPYLELTGPELTHVKMERIWAGQHASQATARHGARTPLIIQDTDLFSTLGYWQFWSPQTVPPHLEQDALATQSDLYPVTTSTGVPFEPDPIRYGGDRREQPDSYWVGVCERYRLPYVILDGGPAQAVDLIRERLLAPNPLVYQRTGVEYAACDPRRRGA